MYARIVTFRVDGPTHDEYRAQTIAVADAFAAWPGLQAKLWLADEEASRYGGIYLFDGKASADRSRDTPEFRSLEDLPIFTDLAVDEFDILPEATAVTASALLAGLTVPA